MASISPPTFPYSTRSFDPTPHKLTYATPKFNTTSRLNYQSTYSSTLLSHPRFIDSSTICRCQKNTDEGNNTDNESPRRWDSAFQDNIRNLINWFNDYMARYDKNRQENVRAKNDDSGGVVTTESEEVIEADWDWERWKKHFAEVDKQELIVSILESQLHLAVAKEDYEEAARIKVAMAAASTNDTVGRVMSQLNIAVKEERYKDAAFARDYASAGLIGWWAGFSDDTQDPYGRIIRITAEHGRYLARSYNPRQLSKVADGTPLFELFITMNKKGEYKHQAVYLKPDEGSKDFPISSSNPSVHIINPHNSIAEKIDLFTKDNEDTDNDGFENILRKDMKIKVMNVTSPEKIDRDLISKVVEQIMEEEEEDDDDEDDEEENDTDLESDTEHYDIDLDVGNTIIDNEGNSQVAVKIVVGDLVQKVSNDTCKDLIRVPAKIKKKNHSSFTFLINKENSLSNSHKDGGIQGGRSIDSVMVDLAKSIGRGKIPMKVLQDVNQLINLTLSQTQNRHLLSGSTTFNRIDLPLTGDPLNGLYVGAHGIYTSEVIHLKRKFGQWKEDGSMDFSNLEFYEYVEAVKITGDPYVPAGQVAFRAKVGTKYQLPHRGIIPEEFGVIARYKGQGRLADPGFQNPRWVDGELVILDGKYTNGGPVVGFVYWAPEYHFLVFFNQLRLQE